jgi:transcriptional regulator GlxA family with amidase domain
VNRQSISEIVAARKAQAEAEAARLAAQQAAEAAERERQESLAEKLAASEAVAETSIAQGVRFVWDFEVTDIASLVMIQRLVTIEPRRAEILSLLKKTAEEGKDVVAIAKTIGLHAFQKPVVSSR